MQIGSYFIKLSPRVPSKCTLHATIPYSNHEELNRIQIKELLQRLYQRKIKALILPANCIWHPNLEELLQQSIHLNFQVKVVLPWHYLLNYEYECAPLQQHNIIVDILFEEPPADLSYVQARLAKFQINECVVVASIHYSWTKSVEILSAWFTDVRVFFAAPIKASDISIDEFQMDKKSVMPNLHIDVYSESDALLSNDMLFIEKMCDQTSHEQPQVSFIVPTKSIDRLKACHKMLLTFSNILPPWELIGVITHDDRDLIPMEKSLIISARGQSQDAFHAAQARNIGACHSRSENLIFFDQDVELTEDVMKELLGRNSILMSPRVHKISKFLGGLQTGYWKNIYSKLAGKTIRPQDFLHFSSTCFAINTDQFKEIGGFAQSFSSYGFEDCHLAYKILNQQYTLKMGESFIVHHDSAWSFISRFLFPLRTSKFSKSAQNIFRLTFEDLVYEKLFVLLDRNPFFRSFLRAIIMHPSLGWMGHLLYRLQQQGQILVDTSIAHYMLSQVRYVQGRLRYIGGQIKRRHVQFKNWAGHWLRHWYWTLTDHPLYRFSQRFPKTYKYTFRPFVKIFYFVQYQWRRRISRKRDIA